MERAQPGRSKDSKTFGRGESQKREDAGARKGRKVAKHWHCVFFPMLCGSAGSKSRLPKAAGMEPAGQIKDEKLHAVVAPSTFESKKCQSTPASEHFWKLRCRKKCAPLLREARLEVNVHKTHHVRTTLGNWDVEKVHAVKAQSTFGSKKCQSTSGSDDFWKLRRLFKSKKTKETGEDYVELNLEIQKTYFRVFDLKNIEATWHSMAYRSAMI